MKLENTILPSEPYSLLEPEKIFSPGLIIFRELLEHNLAEMIRVAGGAERLCPHCKTHKTSEIVQMQIKAGITRHKCATIAEAEMLAEVGAEDVLLAYQLVGPNVDRFVQLIDKFPKTRFASLVDCPAAIDQLSDCLQRAKREPASQGKTVAVLLDLNSGMNRTGIEIGPDAIELYEMAMSADGLEIGGLHWYDGHHRQADAYERKIAVETSWRRLTQFRDQLLLSGLAVPRIVAGGTGSFQILAELEEPNVELSPGTTTFHDTLMTDLFPEMNFRPAIGILTRVVSNNRTNFLTLDVGHKACAADQPAGKRLAFPSLPDAVEVLQSEEHLVIRSDRAGDYQLGDHLVAIPRHACPTTAVHEFAEVIDNGVKVDRWMVRGRNRQLTC